MEEKKPRRTYSKEFKIQAVERAKTIGLIKTAKELGVSSASLSNWKKQLDPAFSDGSSGDRPTYAQLEKEVKRLRKENGYIEEINRVLKKSTAIFSIDQFRDLK